MMRRINYSCICRRKVTVEVDVPENEADLHHNAFTDVTMTTVGWHRTKNGLFYHCSPECDWVNDELRALTDASFDTGAFDYEAARVLWTEHAKRRAAREGPEV